MTVPCYVVFSTHSVFLVDSKIINRHLIVNKREVNSTVHTTISFQADDG